MVGPPSIQVLRQVALWFRLPSPSFTPTLPNPDNSLRLVQRQILPSVQVLRQMALQFLLEGFLAVRAALTDLDHRQRHVL